MIFVDYKNGSKAYRFFDPSTGRVVISRDAMFNEAGEWKWSEQDGVNTASTKPFTIEYIEEYVSGTPIVEQGSTPPRTPSPALTAVLVLQAAPPEDTPIQFVSPPSDDELDLDDNHDDAPLRLCAIDSLVGASMPPGLAPRVLDDELHFTSAEELASFAAAERDAC